MRMRERGVSEGEVLDTLSNYQVSRPGKNGSVGLYYSQSDGSVVTLWVVGTLPLQEPVIIKSVGKAPS
jgi:hypothetical protein